jgi:phospholipid/cholesterol/gamma-HCH transport system permease protein
MPDFQPKTHVGDHWNFRLLSAVLLGGQVVFHLFKGKISRRHVVEHMVNVGAGSFPPAVFCIGAAGMIFTIQTARELSRYGAVEAVGGAFATAFCRELAPVLTAGIVAGQVGCAYAAEIGAMKVSEQIDALYMLKTDPIDYLVIPRVLACCLMLPVLSIVSMVVGIAGGAFVAAKFYNLAPDIFLNTVHSSLEVTDLFSLVLKALIFGAIVGIVGCSWGLTTTGGVKGVGASATAAVVTAWVFIFLVDFVLSLVLFEGLGVSLINGA